MKVVVAIDSFKGSLSSIEAGQAVKAGVLAAHPDANVIIKPLADGGEGTTDAFIEGLGGQRIDLTVTGPMGSPVSCYYGYLEKDKTAIIEMASACSCSSKKSSHRQHSRRRRNDPSCAGKRMSAFYYRNRRKRHKRCRHRHAQGAWLFFSG